MKLSFIVSADNQTLQRKLPDKVLEVERRTEVHHHHRQGGWW